MKTRTPPITPDELITWRTRAENAEAENRAIVTDRATLRLRLQQTTDKLRETTETRDHIAQELKDARAALDQIAQENRKLSREVESLRRDLAAEQQRRTDARTAQEKGGRDVRREG